MNPQPHTLDTRTLGGLPGCSILLFRQPVGVDSPDKRTSHEVL